MLGASYMGGAHRAGAAVYTPLADRDVTIWPDDDEGGVKGADHAARALAGVARSIRVVRVPGGAPQRTLRTSPRRIVSQRWRALYPGPPPRPAAPDDTLTIPMSDKPLDPLFLLVAGALTQRGLGELPPLGTVYRYLPSTLDLWHYNGLVWHQLMKQDTRLMDFIGLNRYRFSKQFAAQGEPHLAKPLADKSSFGEQEKSHSDLQRGLRSLLAGEMPDPEIHLVGTPNGVLNLQDLTMKGHASAFNLRATTGGLYIPGKDDEHWKALKGRLRLVLTDANILELVKLVGLLMTGRAQSHSRLCYWWASPAAVRAGSSTWWRLPWRVRLRY